jgi:hypothetical protein
MLKMAERFPLVVGVNRTVKVAFPPKDKEAGTLLTKL